jgi:hypothetical protein
MYKCSPLAIPNTYHVTSTGLFEFPVLSPSSETGNGGGHVLCSVSASYVLWYSEALVMGFSFLASSTKGMYLSSGGLFLQKIVF